jgi:pimeloyl-ACP methyl ester carboxylesterase
MSTRIALMASITLAFASTAAAQQAIRGAPPDTLLVYTGVFRMGMSHDVAIAPFRTGAGWMLLLADVQTDALRFLTPAGPDAFTAGFETIRPAPVELGISAVRDGSVVRSLTVKMEGAPGSVAARRIPIDAVPVVFANGQVRLKGFVYRPHAARGKLPLIALAHGSEENDRYSFGPIPLVLAAKGFAVLAYDKRGTGESIGDWRPAGLEELADDLVAGIRAVRSRLGIDPARIAVLGVSEGGWVAPIAASRFSGVKAIVTISGGARTKGDAYIHKIRREQEGTGASPVTIDSAVRDAEQLIAASVRRVKAAESPRGFDRRVAYDPTEDWRRFRGPVLYMGGEADVLESGPAAAEWFRRLFAESGNVDVTIRLWPRAHHSLLLGVTGKPSEFRSLEGIKQLAPGYWDVLLRWLAEWQRESGAPR